MAVDTKEFWILTGPHASGKSTFAEGFCENFRERCGYDIYYFNPDQVAKDQGRDVFDVLDEFYSGPIWSLRKRGQCVLVEMTMPYLNNPDLIREFKSHGYKTGVIGVGVATLEELKSNIARRESGGGHEVYEGSVELVYNECRKRMPILMERADESHLYNFSNGAFTEILSRADGGGFVMQVPMSEVAADKNAYMHSIVSNLQAKGLLVTEPLPNANTTRPKLDC